MTPVELAKTLLEKGELKSLLNLFHSHAFSPNLTAEEYFFWGKIAEELNLLEEAKKLYNKAFFQDPSNPQILFALAKIYYNNENYYQTFKILKKLLHLKPKEVSLFSPCKCEFGEKLKDKYPCPLLHIDPSLVPTSYSAKNIYELLKLYSSLQDKLFSLKTLIKNHLKNTQTKTLIYNNYTFFLSEEGRLLVKKTFGEKK